MRRFCRHLLTAALVIAGAIGFAPAASSAADLREIDAANLLVDAELQAFAERLLERANPFAGAIVAAEVPSGRVLVFADRPPAGGKRGDVLLGRLAPAASVFKIVTTAALIERGHVRPDEVVCTDGGIRSIERKHLERPRTGKALCAPFRSALGHSRNAAYAQLVTRALMRNDLVEMGERFGFGRNVRFDGAEVAFGKLQVPYGDLDFARTAAGFRGSRLSVLGGLTIAGIVANRGRPLSFRIEQGDAPNESAPQVIRPSTAAELTRMMEVTVHSGTSFEVFSDEDKKPYLPGIRVAGKTGTLQPSANDPTTTWFIGFAPSRKPKIVVSVLLQNGKVWRKRANELARDLLIEYFDVR